MRVQPNAVRKMEQFRRYHGLYLVGWGRAPRMYLSTRTGALSVYRHARPRGPHLRLLTPVEVTAICNKYLGVKNHG